MKEKISFISFSLLFCVFIAGNSVSAQGISPIAGYTFTQNLTVGMSGNDVTALQQFLITGGFLDIVAPTGYFGPLTRVALGAWQASAGISPSIGFFGPISRGILNAAAPLAPLVPIEPIRVPSTVASTTVTVAPPNVTAVTGGDGSPTRLIIPGLNVVAGFQYNGLAPDGTLEIPTNVTDVGWFTGSPRPGEKGVSIMTGHVARIQNSVVTKQGVFFDLNMLRPGDKLYVLNDKGEVVTFVVRESRLYDPAAVTTEIFNATDDGIHLNLITCEGVWNQSQLSFSERLVVFTDAVQ